MRASRATGAEEIVMRASVDSAWGQRWARWTTRRRRAILGSALLLAVAATPITASLPLHGDLSYLLPPGTTSVRDLHALEARAQVFGTIIVAIDSDDPRRRLAAAQRIHDRLRALPASAVIGVGYDGAAKDRFTWDHRQLLVPTEDLTAMADDLRARKARANPLFVSLDDDDRAAAKAAGPIGGRLRGLKAELDAAEAGARAPAPLISKDGRLQIIVVRTRFAAGEVSRNAATLAAVAQIVDEARRLEGADVQIGITGDVVNTAAEHRALTDGMLRATVFTVVIVAAGLLFFFAGSPAAVAALLGALAIGALCTFAFARLAVGHLNLATAFLAPIVVGNGINFGIILLARYFEERRHTADPVLALGAAVAGSFGGTLAAALAASVSYASLLATDFRGYRHFGVIGGVGILLCWATTFLVLPAALAALEARGLCGGRSPARLGARLARFVPRRRATTVVVALLVLGGSTLGACRYLTSRPFESDFKNLRSSGPEMRQARRWNDEINAAFGRGISDGTIIALPSRQRAREVAERLRAADRGKPAADRLFARITTFDDFVPPDQDVKLARLSEIRALLTPSTLATMSQADRQVARALDPPARLGRIADGDVPPELAWPFTEQDGTRGRLIVATTGAGFDLWRTEDLDRFVRTFRGLDLGSDLVVGGNAFVQHDIVRSVDSDGPRATATAAIGAAVVVLLILGASRQAAVTLICAASGILLLLSAACLCRLKINFLDFVALPITIGIGVDYAVNLAARHRVEGPGSATRILTTSGPAVALCSYTTVVGYASLLLSENQGIRSFGLAALIGELTCLGCALALAPALLDLRLRTRARPGRAIGVPEGAARAVGANQIVPT
jgi:predicted RND superfamily exporter protein